VGEAGGSEEDDGVDIEEDEVDGHAPFIDSDVDSDDGQRDNGENAKTPRGKDKREVVGDQQDDEITFADLKLDLTTHDLSCGDHKVHLSGKEFAVMQMLMSSNSRVVSKQDLLSRVWGTSGDASENSVEAYISFLRKKVSHIHSHVQITTLRMLGYRLEDFSED